MIFIADINKSLDLDPTCMNNIVVLTNNDITVLNEKLFELKIFNISIESIESLCEKGGYNLYTLLNELFENSDYFWKNNPDIDEIDEKNIKLAISDLKKLENFFWYVYEMPLIEASEFNRRRQHEYEIFRQ